MYIGLTILEGFQSHTIKQYDLLIMNIYCKWTIVFFDIANTY